MSEIRLTTAEDVTDEVLAAALEYAEGFADWDDAGRLVIDWDETYSHLETGTGYFVTEMDTPADRKIRRHVRRAMQEAE